jgi:hypothetical protein
VKRYTEKLSFRYAERRLIYEIHEENGCAVYRIGGKGEKYYFSMDHELINIFNKYKLTPYKRKDKRLIFTYRDSDGKQYHLFAHNLAHGVYNGIIHCDTFYNDVRDYCSRKGALTVDHADGNMYNITRHNLSWMTKAENLRKGNVTKKLKMPERLVIAYDGSGYRVELTVKVTNSAPIAEQISAYGLSLSGCGICRICTRADNAEKLIEIIHGLTNAKMGWREPLRINKRWVESAKKGEAMVDVAVRSINEQRRLMSEPQSTFC